MQFPESWLREFCNPPLSTQELADLLTMAGLEVEELCRADLTGEWEYKLAQMEKGQLTREAFMQQIQAMTEKLVKKAKEYDRDTIPGDYATLATPCPNCGGTGVITEGIGGG